MPEVCWEAARRGDKAEIDKIVAKYYKVAYKIAHKWARSGQIEESEALGLANIAIMKCVTKGTFDETRGIKFTSYLGSAVHNEIRMFLRKERRVRSKNVFSLDQPLPYDIRKNGNSHVENLTYADIMLDEETLEEQLEEQFSIEDALQSLDAAMDVYTDLELRCMSLYLTGMTMKKVSQQIGCSQNFTRKLLQSAHEKLREQHRLLNDEELLYGHS